MDFKMMADDESVDMDEVSRQEREAADDTVDEDADPEPDSDIDDSDDIDEVDDDTVADD